MVTHSDIPPPAFSSSSSSSSLSSSSSSLESSDWLHGRRGVPTTWAPFLSNETLPRLKTNNCDTNREENCKKTFHLFSEAWKVGMIRDDRFGWSNLVCTTWGVIVEILLIAKKLQDMSCPHPHTLNVRDVHPSSWPTPKTTTPITSSAP